ncbi:hypothetical protein SAMN04488063_0491 [Halopelagius inordinatus]|uniref:Uncharacterized protein n=1 Tax=Halopelagius inordinatus TaxID=553467 RepID=A0A1I2M434_9EURY|nr:hypothetical protein [Halopelagius inordinatus]SFF84206.1 hypothetical protein SAMN04488063_0491 [Halopelagius inordinatus]
MGLKCRLLGHEYGDPEIERERQENGDEVVVTIRELQVCKRCENEHLVSENKEVTSIRSPSEVGLDDGGASGGPSPGAASAPDPSPAPDATPVRGETDDSDPASHISEAEPDAPSVESGPSPADVGVDAGVADDEDDDFEPPQDPDEDDAVILDDDEEGERDSTQWPEETTADPAAAAEESAAAEDIPEDLPRDGDGEPVTDDAELIDADETHSVSSADQSASRSGDAETPADRGHGEWPARESPPADESGSNAPWPEQTGEDEGFDAEPSDGTPAEVAFGGGLTPEANGHAESRDAIDGVASSDEGFTRADEETELEADVPDERVEFYCPNCGHARTAGASSMRAGDICPECKKGYIAERQL